MQADQTAACIQIGHSNTHDYCAPFFSPVCRKLYGTASRSVNILPLKLFLKICFQIFNLNSFLLHCITVADCYCSVFLGLDMPPDGLPLKPIGFSRFFSRFVAVFVLIRQFSVDFMTTPVQVYVFEVFGYPNGSVFFIPVFNICVFIAVSLFFRAVLDFAGVVVFIPVLARVLEQDGDIMSVLPVAGAAMAFILVKSLLVIWLTRYRSRYVYSLYGTLADMLLRNFMKKGLLFIRQSNSVDLANKVNAVTMTFTSGVILSLLNILSSAMLLIIILAALFMYEPLPTLALVLVVGPFMFFYSFFVRNRVKRLGETENRARRDQARTVFELFRGYPEYCINDAVEHQMGLFHGGIDKVSEVRIRTESYSAASSGFMEITVMLSVILLMLLSMSASWGMSMTFGIFALAAMKILPSVRSIVAGWQSVQSSRYSTDVLKEILSQENEDALRAMPVSSGRSGCRTAVHPPDFSRTISLRSVSFRYAPEAPELFRNFSMEIGKGEYVGIKGHSGAGKTTLFHLLMGFYFPQSGALYVDDEKITPDNAGEWQSMLGYVPQDVFLINGTFVENIALGQSPDRADRRKIEHILAKVGLLDWISSLPHGMDTRLAEAGNSVSGGQKQRIGIARALYKGASVLFFDEATSSVDVEAESEINRFFSGLSREDDSLTVIVIAHRQETLASCSRIIDLDRIMKTR